MVYYRCCPHCELDSVHAIEPDEHEVPCNAPNSSGCIGRTVSSGPAVQPQPGPSKT